MDAIANSKIGKSIAKSRPVKFVKRLFPLLLALWIQIDMLLDVRQSITYFNHGTGDGAYAKWALKYQNETNSTYLHTVSETYFNCASIIWITSPLLLSVSLLIMSKNPVGSWVTLMGVLVNYEIKFFENCGTCVSIILGIIFCRSPLGPRLC